MIRPLMAALFGIIGCGAGQIYNQQYWKGAFFIIFGVIINQYSHLNRAVVLSFQGNIDGAISVINYQWGLYYLSFYLGAIYEAYIEAYQREYKSNPPALHALTVIFGVTFGVIGIILGKTSMIGPVFLGLLFVLSGVGLGVILAYIFRAHN